MQLDDADAGDVGKEKDARAPPCGATRREDSDRRQCEKEVDVDDLLGATTLPMPGAGAGPADDDGDDGHHVDRDADARKVTRGDCWAAASAALLRLPTPLPMSLVVTSGGGVIGFFLERLGRWKHVHLRMPPPLPAGSASPPISGCRSGGGGGLMVSRGIARGDRGTSSSQGEVLCTVG